MVILGDWCAPDNRRARANQHVHLMNGGQNRHESMLGFELGQYEEPSRRATRIYGQRSRSASCEALLPTR